MKENIIHIDLLNKEETFEFASINDADLMNIKCFATTEGTNKNKLLYRREVLARCYRTFIDKPVFITADSTNNPTGHGFNFKTKKFDDKRRKAIGHIVSASQVVVDSEDNIHYIDGYSLEDIPEGEYRIVVDMVVYKKYFTDITTQLEFLHDIGCLSFSMESLVDCNIDEDGVKDCTDITFTGLAIVENPAFENSKSIEVAEEEDEQVNYEELYNAERVKNETLVAEKVALETEVASVKEEMEAVNQEIASVKEELAGSKVEVTELNSEIENLKPFKEKVEIAEKEELGKARQEKLSKFTQDVVEIAELSEMTNEQFADLLIEKADSYQVAEANDGVEGVIRPKTSMSNKNSAKTLMEVLAKI